MNPGARWWRTPLRVWGVVFGILLGPIAIIIAITDGWATLLGILKATAEFFGLVPWVLLRLGGRDPVDPVAIYVIGALAWTLVIVGVVYGGRRYEIWRDRGKEASRRAPAPPPAPVVPSAPGPSSSPPPDPRWADLVREIKEAFEEDYEELVLKHLTEARIHFPGPMNDFAPRLGVWPKLLWEYQAGHKAFVEEWRKHTPFLAFKARVEKLSSETTIVDVEEVVRSYRASVEEYRRLRQRIESKTDVDVTVLRRSGASEESILQRVKPWQDLKVDLEAFEKRLEGLDRHLRAQDPHLKVILSGGN